MDLLLDNDSVSINFVGCDNGIVVVKDVFTLRRYLLGYFEVNYIYKLL